MTSSTTFTKLYSGILDSTLWCEPDRTRLMWICMLAMADQYGRVMGSVPGLANRARVPLDDARAAIRAFLDPDPDSRTKDFEGRRIEEIDGGWRLLNHAKYRELRAEDDRREQNRLAQARARDRKRDESAKVSTRQHESAESAHTEADADAVRDMGAIAPSSSAAPKTPTIPCPYQSIVDLFHEKLPSLPKVRLMGTGRQKALRKLWGWVLRTSKPSGERRATTAEQALAWIGDYFERAAENDFVTGRRPPGAGHEGWRADIDYLLTEKGMKQVFEKTEAAA